MIEVFEETEKLFGNYIHDGTSQNKKHINAVFLYRVY